MAIYSDYLGVVSKWPVSNFFFLNFPYTYAGRPRSIAAEQQLPTSSCFKVAILNKTFYLNIKNVYFIQHSFE